MIFRHLLVSAIALSSCGVLDASAAGSNDTAAREEALRALMQQQAMIFFVAKGDAGACGRGCSEWIAAEGMIDGGAAQPVRVFLGALPRRALPVFFNSTGGDVGQAVALGTILRERRMTVGVGRTLAEGCRQTVDEACRRMLQSKPEHRARLTTSGTTCLSACVYAFMGGSVRHVARDARLGVHTLRRPLPAGTPSTGSPPRASIHHAPHLVERYLVEMGVDPRLLDIAPQGRAHPGRYLRPNEVCRRCIKV